MNAFKLLPVLFCCLLLAAHFFRAGVLPLVIVSLTLPGLLLFRHRWIARLVQVFLILGAFEWARTLLILVGERRAAGAPWSRLAIILGVVTLLTAASALLFRCRSLRNRYRLD